MARVIEDDCLILAKDFLHATTKDKIIIMINN